MFAGQGASVVMAGRGEARASRRRRGNVKVLPGRDVTDPLLLGNGIDARPAVRHKS